MDRKTWWYCFFGPRIFQIYGQMSNYEPDALEKFCDRLMKIIELSALIPELSILGLFLFAIFHVTILHHSAFILKMVMKIWIVYMAAYFGRGVARSMNEQYLEFLRVLFNAIENRLILHGDIMELRRYDFEFRHWPVNYEWRDENDSGELVPPRRFLAQIQPPPDEGTAKKTILNGLAYLIAHTVGPALIYPGTLKIYQRFREEEILSGRQELVEKHNGRRVKLRSWTGNCIDAMFVDRRGRNSRKGDILVISCEGNGGMFEFGAACAPLAAGYSVLMWNHPGFGGSEGVPYPKEEAGAIDVVIQFALFRLNWDERDMAIYGWSVGGFAATWAVMNYPNLRALILDASFDDVLPLALHAVRPLFLSTLIARAIRQYFDLRNDVQLRDYNGPVLVIRRLNDYIMAVFEGTLNMDMLRKVNQTNFLLKSLLARRYPHVFRPEIMPAVDEWLSETAHQRAIRYRIPTNAYRSALRQYDDLNKGDLDVAPFPWSIGEHYEFEARRSMAIFLVSRYLLDVDLSHGDLLPARMLLIPAHPWE